MKIELKKISYNARLSDKTSAYTAEVWIDGVRRGTTMNHGTGGPDAIFPRELEREINEYAKTLPPLPPMESLDAPLPQCAELIFGALLDVHLARKRLKRLMAKKIVFVHEGRVYTCRTRAEPTAATAVVLNDLPLDAAVALYLAQESSSISSKSAFSPDVTTIGVE